MDPLISTKLRVPQARPKLVARPRLTERLNRESGRRLTLITAPAGFGKTTLLGEWMAGRSDERSVAWASLDEGDNDPARFSYLVAALRTIEDGFGEGILLVACARIAASGGIDWRPYQRTRRHPGQLGHSSRRLSPHRLRSCPWDRCFLAERLPSNVHLVISSRIDPPLPLARLRARGQITEINAADLSFTREEAVSFLKDTMGLNLVDEDVAALEERTEGWIAGLQLAALSMRDREDIPGFVRAFSGSHRDVLDFLAEEVLERQSERVRSLSARNLDSPAPNGELCDAVTDREDGQEMLETLERENLFVVV